VVPGVEELLALSEVYRLAAVGPWEVVVVDCGPTAETLRLLALPEALSGYVERLFPTHRRVVRGMLAGLAGVRPADHWDAAADALGRLAERLTALRAALADRSRTTVRLVTTPERVVTAETQRTLTALAVQGIRVDGLIANRLVPVFGPAPRRVRDLAAHQARRAAGRVGGPGRDNGRAVAHRATPGRRADRRAGVCRDWPASCTGRPTHWGDGPTPEPLLTVSGRGRGPGRPLRTADRRAPGARRRRRPGQGRGRVGADRGRAGAA